MSACTCNVSLKNTGTPNCAPVQDVAYLNIFVPLKANDGTLNRLDLSSAIDSTLINGLINNTNKTKRWFPLPAFENVEGTRAESEFETFESGNKRKMRQGIYTFTGHVIDQGPDFLKKLNSFDCVEMGVYIVDKNGNLIGDNTVSGYLAPIPVGKSTLENIFMRATETTSAKIMVKYDYKQTFKDENLGMVTADDITGIDLMTIAGLLDVNGAVVSGTISTTGFTIDLTTDFGSLLGRVPVSGLVAADFTLYNNTSDAAVTISTAVESTSVEGRYAFTFVAQTTADVLVLSVSKDGFDSTNLDTVTITIP